MNIRELLTEIDSIQQIVTRWNEQQPIPRIERSMVMDKLKNLYEGLWLNESCSAKQPDKNETVEDTIYTAPEALPIPDAPTPCVVADQTPSEFAELSLEHKLYEDDLSVRQTLDKQAILSLYGDRPTTPAQPQNSFIPPHGSQKETAPLIPDAASKKVFGEAFNTGKNVAMNDALSKQTAHGDVASKIQSHSVVNDLRQAIGINDRFMLIRALFNGDGEAYNHAIDKLNSFGNLDDAIIYIQENFTWDPDSESVRLIVDLLERKLN